MIQFGLMVETQLMLWMILITFWPSFIILVTFLETRNILLGNPSKLYFLLNKCKSTPLKPKTLFTIIWFFCRFHIVLWLRDLCVFKSKECERLYLKFCKRIVNVRLNSCNAAVYGELGRYPMCVPRYIRTIKYWCKYHT